MLTEEQFKRILQSLPLLEHAVIAGGQSFSEKSVAQAIQLSDEKYCSLAATIRPTT